MSKIILGISAFYHDSSACLIVDGDIVAAVQEERFSRVKNDASFPIRAIEFCLKESKINVSDINIVAYYDKPFLKFERLIENYYEHAPRGFLSFAASMPIWVKERIFLKKIIRRHLKSFGNLRKEIKILFPEHHLSHAASSFYPSPYNDAAVVTIDGVGEWASTTIMRGFGNKMQVLEEIHFPNSIGLFYSSFTYFLGFKVNSGEYKMMGLAPYGNERGSNFRRFYQIIKEELIEIFDDGSYQLSSKLFSYSTSLKMIPVKRWENLFGLSRRKPESNILMDHCDLALAAQRVTEELVLGIVKRAKELTGSSFLCLAGGVALNCVNNGKLVESSLFEDVFIQPASGDAGGSIGAALAAHYIYLGSQRTNQDFSDSMKGCLLGPSFERSDISFDDSKYDCVQLKESDLLRKSAKYIEQGNVVGWFQGPLEFGPRALGCRSILGDPRRKEMQRLINSIIKKRESFRPFAPAVLKEYADKFFEIKGSSDYMLKVFPVKSFERSEYLEGSIHQQLSAVQSKIPAVTHVDGSARVQTVGENALPRFRRLIESFYELTDCPMLINTSFNVRGEPIVCTPQDAFNCFENTEMDVLVLENRIFTKK